MGKINLPIARMMRPRRPRQTPHVPGAASEANADTHKALQRAYAQGIEHGMRRGKFADRARLFVYSVVLACVGFGATYGGARALEFVDSWNDAPAIVECGK